MFIGGMVTGKFVLQIYTVLISLLILGFFLLFRKTIAVALGCNWRLFIFLPGRTATRRQPKPWGRCTGVLTLSHTWSTSQIPTGSCCHQTSGAKFTKKWAMWFIFQVAGVLRQYFLLHIFPQYSVFPLFSLLSARFLLLFFPLSRSSIILSPTFCHIPTLSHISSIPFPLHPQTFPHLHWFWTPSLTHSLPCGQINYQTELLCVGQVRGWSKFRLVPREPCDHYCPELLDTITEGQMGQLTIIAWLVSQMSSHLLYNTNVIITVCYCSCLMWVSFISHSSGGDKYAVEVWVYSWWGHGQLSRGNGRLLDIGVCVLSSYSVESSPPKRTAAI